MIERGINTFLSYLSVFTLGIYAYMSTHGVAVGPHRWFLTSIFAVYFFIVSKKNKQINELES